MTNADRLQRWNQLYDRTPERWRFQVAVWALVAVGAINMLLTIAVGFPFALLLGLAILAMAAVRVPYALGWLRTEGDASAAEGAGTGARMEIEAPSWMIRVNRWYDGLDETQRPLVLLAALAIPGALNMLLTFAGGFPFGLLFLLAVLALVVIRAPYTAGWYKEPASEAGPALGVEPAAPRISDESAQNSSFGATPPAAEAEPVPAGPPARRTAKARSNGGAAATPADPRS